jgi:16S rRNA processing protein RimM
MTQYFKIGKLAASHGLHGDLILNHSLGKKTALKGLEAIFIEDKKDSFIPYFIEKTSVKSDSETFLKLEGINTKEAARKLTPKEVWLQQSDFVEHSAKSAPIALLGYNLFDNDQFIGEIIEVIEQPHQILCTILYKGKEALIPIHEESLKKIDKKKKEIVVDLPEGLLDIYTNA